MSSVMPALVAGIHVFHSFRETWMAGTKASEATPFVERLCPAMTMPRGIVTSPASVAGCGRTRYR